MNASQEQTGAIPEVTAVAGEESAQKHAALPWYRAPLLISLIVFTLAAGLRIGHYASIQHTPLHENYIHLVDACYYDLLARRIVSGAGFSDDVYFMAPLYPYALSLVYAFHEAPRNWRGELEQYGPEIHTAAYVQCLIGALLCVLIYRLARRLAGEAAGVIAGLFAALYAPFIFHDTQLMATQLITLTNVIAMLVFLCAAKSKGPWLWLLGGVMLALCILAHGTALLLIPGVLLWILVGVPAPGPRTRILRCLLVCLPVMACLGATARRNYVVGKDIVPLTSNAGLTFYIGNGPGATGSFRFLPPELSSIHGSTLLSHYYQKERQPDDPKPSEVSRKLRDLALENIKNDPAGWLGLLWRKVRLFWYSIEVGTNYQFYFHKRFSAVLDKPLLSLGVIAPLGLAGLICSLRRWREFLLVYIWLATQLVAFTVMFVLARYRMVAVACILIFAAYQIVWWVNSWRCRRYGLVGLSVLIVAIAAVFVHWPIEGFGRTRGWGLQYYLLGQRQAVLGNGAEATACLEEAMRHNFLPHVDDEKWHLKCFAFLVPLYEAEGNREMVTDAARRALRIIDSRPRTDANLKAREYYLRALLRSAAPPD